MGSSNPALARTLQYRQRVYPREMIAAYAILKRAAAIVNHEGGRLAAGNGVVPIVSGL